MSSPRLSKADERFIGRLVGVYKENRHVVGIILDQLTGVILGSPELMKHVHSTKSRLKDVGHLEGKLRRKFLEAKSKGTSFSITERNLLTRINDLAGLRILHLHTRQMSEIDRELRRALQQFGFRLHEKPTASTWDDESRTFFESIGIKWRRSANLYTSVHYVVKSNSNLEATCEIQVRTLAEELWGEVDHTLNYPTPSTIHACREQIRVLARVTSSCSRLVDSIFQSASLEAGPR